jgi:5,5'-dehydrodivanillate O-demethylase oxygenase subunit
MLNEEENNQLTQVGPGTPMGDLLRRYWHPVAAAGELDEHPTRPVRLLGEDLVLFKTGEDSYGLVERFCAHRLTDLAYGSVEDFAIRCPRHGWLYSDTGQCVDMPLEEEPFCEDVKLKAYKAQTKAGMIWAYAGPEPAPLIPDWEPFSWQDGVVQVVMSVLPCNWLQCQENSVDAIDMELLEAAFLEAARTGQPPQLPDADFAYDEFEHGFLVRTSDDRSAVTKTSLWPNGLFSGDSRSCRLEWRVPMDDKTTLNFAWFIDRVAPGKDLPLEQRVFHWWAPTRDEETGEALNSHQLNKKFAIWLNQAPVLDRTKENLTDGDEGVLMLRGKLFSQMALIADGGEPKGIIRSLAQNTHLRLPYTQPLAIGAPAQEEASGEEAFPYLAGQPEDVAEAYKKVVQTWREASKDEA